MQPFLALKLSEVKDMSKKQGVKYALATIYTLFIGYYTLFHNNIPEFYWLAIFLASTTFVFSFGIAEGVWKKSCDWTFSSCPVTYVGVYLVCFCGIMTLIQIAGYLIFR